MPRDRRLGHGIPAPAATAAAKLTIGSPRARGHSGMWVLGCGLAGPGRAAEAGQPTWCSSHRAENSTRRNYNSLNVHQGASTEQVCVCAYGHMHTGMPHTQCKTQARCLHSFLQRGQGSSLQNHGDTSVGKPGCFPRQDLQATKPAQAKNEGGKAASRAVEDASEDRLSSWPPAEDCIVL